MAPKRTTVGLLFGGKSPEHEVSIVTARSIRDHLDPQRYAVQPIGVARNGVWVLKEDPFARLAAGELPKASRFPFLPLEEGAEESPLPDVFFVALHGVGGEDGQIQGYLELLGRPYTGGGRLALSIGMDKWMARNVWEGAGIPMAPARGVTEERWKRERDAVLKQLEPLGLPVFVKPANLGSSIGVTKVKSRADLARAIDFGITYDRRVLVEKGLDVREIEVAVLGGDEPFVSVPGEVIPSAEFYTFEDKYIAGRSSTKIPAEVPPEVAEEARRLAARAYQLIDGFGMGRVDFFLERSTHKLYLNEINFIPGFTHISMYPKMMAQSGVPYGQLITRLLDLAFERFKQLGSKQTEYVSGSSWYKGG